MCCVAHEYRARLGRRLHPCGHVQGFAEGECALRTPRTKGADDARAAVHPNPDPQSEAEIGDRFEDVERGPYRLLGGRFVGTRIAKEHQHPVAGDLVYRTSEPLNNVGDSVVVAPDCVAEIFAVEDCRQLRRTNEVTEHRRNVIELCVRSGVRRVSTHRAAAV